MQLLLTYPFSDGTLGAMKGDYTNLHVTADLNLRNLAGNLGVPTTPPGGGTPTLPIDPSLPIDPDNPLPGVPLPGQTPSSSSTSPAGGMCLPGVTCQGSARSQGSSDGSWRSLYTGARHDPPLGQGPGSSPSCSSPW